MDLASGFTPVTAFDRPRLAAYNLARGDLEGAQRALTNPDSLSPAEQQATGSGPVGSLIRLATNPLVLIGAVLARKWPYHTAAELAGFGKELTAAGKALPPMLWRLWGHSRIFEGTKFGDILFNKLLPTVSNYKDSLTSTYSQGLLAFEKRAGRAINGLEDRAVGLAMDEGANKIYRGQYREMLYREQYGERAFRSAYKERVDPLIEQKAARAFTFQDQSVVPQEVLQSARATTAQSIARMHESPENVQRIADRQARKVMNQAFKDKDVDLYQRLRTDYDSGVLTERMKKGLEPIEGYFPHEDERLPRDKMLAYQREVAGTQMESRAERRAKSLANVELTSDRYLRRRNAMLPSRADMEQLSPYLTPETREAYEMLFSRMGSKTGEVRQYSLRSGPVLKSFIHDTGRAYAWTAKGYGPMLQRAAIELKENDPAKIKTRIAEDVLIPIAKGKLSPQEADAQVAWSALQAQAQDYFRRPSIVKALGGENSRVVKTVQGYLGSDSFHKMSFKSAGAKLASYMYGSALGGNPMSVAMNSLQTVLTTSGVLEPKYIGKGLQETTKRVGRVAQAMQKGISLEAAFAQEIPEYGQMLGTEIEVEALSALKNAELEGRLPGKLEKLQHALMMPFSMSERGNKLVAYFGGRAKALAEGLNEAQAVQVGQRVMEMTQFPGGLAGTPAMMTNLWPPLRQFTQFPLRTLDLFTRDPGTAGRMILGSGIALEAGRAAGLELGNGLLWGALPIPQNPDSPFYPLPIVPPILGLAGGVASDLAQGKWDQIPRELGLLVPGGVALERATTVMAPALAQKLGRPYVDYNAVQPDGSYPMFSSDGMLKGFKSPMALIGEGLGWGSMLGDKESQAVKWIVANRDRLRQAHREYVEALASNDMAKAQHINETYKQAYPFMGDIVVKPQDLQAVHMRHDVSRLERIMETLPAEARQEFGNNLSVALGSSYETLLGVDPALLGTQQTAKARDQFRQTPFSEPTKRVGSFVEQMRGDQSQLGQKRDQAMSTVLRQDQAGKKPSSPFGSFENFSSF
jgi:hypothetical protein